LVGRRSSSRLVHIHPTPASTAVEITAETAEPSTLDILTSEGESVLSRGINVGSNTVKVNVDYLQPGIYGCRLRTERGVLQVVPFIIVR
jgi:hypothetical protein